MTMKATRINVQQLEDALREITMPRVGRPRKSVKVDNLQDATIIPVANGYMVRSQTTKTDIFVFETLDKAFEFVRAKLAPTGEQSEFLNQV